MKAWTIDSLGAAPRLAQLDPPAPQPGKLRVRVGAVGLNFADLLMAQGKYQERVAPPYIPGMELAGVLMDPSDSGLAPGTRVAAFAGHGALAEIALVPQETVVPLPDAMGLDEAAAFLVAYGTSHLALCHKANLRPGETLLVLGAAGGVGLTAVEIGKRMGARVIASARGAEKLAIARAVGADEVIDSDTPDLKAALKAMGGVDVTYDAVGGPAFLAALSASRPEGRLLTIGFASGEVPSIPANHLLVKNLSVMGLYWGGYLRFAPQVLSESLRQLFDWYQAGGLRPHISHRLAFEEFPAGLDLLQGRKSTGKVVIWGHHAPTSAQNP